jgi:hypothetical protein
MKIPPARKQRLIIIEAFKYELRGIPLVRFNSKGLFKNI